MHEQNIKFIIDKVKDIKEYNWDKLTTMGIVEQQVDIL